MIPSVAVLLVLACASSSVVYADKGIGDGQAPQRPDYLQNNHGQLLPYGVGDLSPGADDDDSRRERYFRERQLRERYTFGPEGHQRSGLRSDRDARRFDYRDRRPYAGQPSPGYDGYYDRYRDRYHDQDYRYYLRPFDEDRPDDFGRFSIRIDEGQEPGSVIYYNLPVSPRFER